MTKGLRGPFFSRFLQPGGDQHRIYHISGDVATIAPPTGKIALPTQITSANRLCSVKVTHPKAHMLRRSKLHVQFPNAAGLLQETGVFPPSRALKRSAIPPINWCVQWGTRVDWPRCTVSLTWNPRNCHIQFEKHLPTLMKYSIDKLKES